MTTESTALATPATTEALSTTRYEPRDLKALNEFAQMVAGSGLCPNALRGKPNDILLVLMRGAETGLTALNALQNLHVVHGKIGMSADLIRARCLADPDCRRFDIIEASPEKATLLVEKKSWPKGEQAKVVFTIEDAKRAGLVKPDSGWSKWPEDMCVARVSSRGGRRYFPHVLAGLHAVEELEDIEPREKNITPSEERASRIVDEVRKASGKAEVEPEAPANMSGEEFVEGLEPVEEETEAEPEQEATAPPDDAFTGDFDAKKIGERFRKLLLAEVKGVGLGIINSLEHEGLLTAQQIVNRGAALKKVPGIGATKAEALVAYCQGLIDQRPAPEEEVTEEDAEAEEKAAAGDEPHVFTLEDVEALQDLATIHEIGWGDVKKRIAKMLGFAGDPNLITAQVIVDRLTAGQWEMLSKWISSATQEVIPEVEAAAPEKATTPSEAHADVKTISTQRYQMLKGMLTKAAEGLDEPAQADFYDGFKALLDEIGVPDVAEKRTMYIPESEWGKVLSWLSANAR